MISPDFTGKVKGMDGVGGAVSGVAGWTKMTGLPDPLRCAIHC